MAVGSDGKWPSVPDRTSNSVSLKVSATNDYAPGVRGFFERWASVFTGLGITAKRTTVKPTTLRYPDEKLTLSPRWRGALQAHRHPRPRRHPHDRGGTAGVQRAR